MRWLEVKVEDKIEIIAVNVPLMFDPKTTAPVYFIGSFAAIPKIVFWYTPFATKKQLR